MAVGTVGDTQDALITMLVERHGLTARDITRVAMPSRSTSSTILSLKMGAFSAAVVNADELFSAKKRGFAPSPSSAIFSPTLFKAFWPPTR